MKPGATDAGPIAKDLPEKGGFKVQMVPLDFRAIVARRLRAAGRNPLRSADRHGQEPGTGEPSTERGRR